MCKVFSTAVVFSLCQGQMVVLDFGEVHEAIEFITGQSVWTHQLPRVMVALEPTLKSQFPWAYSAEAIESSRLIKETLDSGAALSTLIAAIDRQMTSLSEKFGATHKAIQIADPALIHRNPIAEAQEIFGKGGE